MFSGRVTSTDQFLEMPLSAHALYFHLGMNADDDGFVSPQKVVRMIGANGDDLKLLVAKGFVIPFESGVIVITHWKENNYIQSDRYTPSIYQSEMEKLSCIQNVYTSDTQVRLGKVRLEVGNTEILATPAIQMRPRRGRKGKKGNDSTSDDPEMAQFIVLVIDTWAEVFNDKEMVRNWYANTSQRRSITVLRRRVKNDEKFIQFIRHLPELITRPYFPKPTTPYELNRDFVKLLAMIKQEENRVAPGSEVISIP